MKPQNDLSRQEIFSGMKDKDTEELLKIWKENDREEWSNEAFEVIHDILLERLEKVPEQGGNSALAGDSPGFEYNRRKPYHSSTRLLGMASWANVISWIVLCLGAFIFIIQLINLIKLEPDISVLRYSKSIYILTPYLTHLSTFAFDIFLFVVLQGLSQCIYILIDIFEAKRKA